MNNALTFTPPFKLGLDLLMTLPPWAGYFVLGLIVLGYVSAAGFILARLGFKPLWALLLAVPGLQVLAFYLLAWARWPREEK